MIKDSIQLESSKIWENVKIELDGEDIKPQTIQTPEFGPISQKMIIKLLKDVFKAKPPKRHGNARSLVFDQKILDKLGQVYDLDINVKVKKKEENTKGTHETHGALSGNRIGLYKHISDTEIKDNKEKSTENSDNSSQISSEEDKNNEESNENNTLNNDSYSYNEPQASQASQQESPEEKYRREQEEIHRWKL
jgi:hypothetical protein